MNVANAFKIVTTAHTRAKTFENFRFPLSDTMDQAREIASQITVNTATARITSMTAMTG